MKQSAASALIEDQFGDPAVYHGGALAAARLQFPDAPTPWPISPPASIRTLIRLRRFRPEVLTRLPDAVALTRLLSAAAGAYGAQDAQHIVAATETQALIQYLPKLFPARRVAILGFGYQEYPALWRAAGADVIVTDNVKSLTETGVERRYCCQPQ